MCSAVLAACAPLIAWCSGKKISVIMGTNQDEFALFLAAIDLVVPKVKLPFRMGDMQTVANHLIQYHYHWNETVLLI